MLRGSVFARRAGGAFPKIFREMSAIKYRLDYKLAPMTIGKGWCVQVKPRRRRSRTDGAARIRDLEWAPRPAAEHRPRPEEALLCGFAGKQRRVNRSRSTIFPRSNLNGVWREAIGDRSEARWLCGASR